MEINNGIIPNVSCVFRDLIKLSSTNPRFHSNTQNNESYSGNTNFTSKNTYQPYTNTKDQSSFPSNMVENDRQKRHQALMNRLQNSLQENRQLLGGQQNPSYEQRNNNNNFSHQLNDSRRNYPSQYSPFGSYRNQKQRHQTNQYGTNSYSYKKQQEQSKKWQPPKLKYRHIEDINQKSVLSIDENSHSDKNMKQKSYIESTLPEYLMKQMKLKSEFYESQQQNQQKQNNRNFSSQKGQSTQYAQGRQIQASEVENYIQDQQQFEQQQPNINKLSILSQKSSSKYSQNLESYYDICRKPVKPSVIVRKSMGINEQKSNAQSMNDKFIRKQTPKIQGINLEKAMKILSLDD